MDFDYLYLRVLKFLSFRPRSEKEIRDYLAKKLKEHPGVIPAQAGIQKKEWIPDQVRDDNSNGLIDLIVHKLKQEKFLNDREFAKMWVRSRTEYKPKGERLIRLELKQKGISKDLIDEAFKEYDADQDVVQGDIRDEVLLAVQLLERKRKKYEGMDRQERFNKAGAMLARRGFDLEAIKTAIDQVFSKVV